VAGPYEGKEVVGGPEGEEDPDPLVAKPYQVNQCRKISAAFIKRILTEKDWRDKLAPQGLRISGAMVTESLDLTAVHITPWVWLGRSRFEKVVKLSWAQFDGGLSFKGSTFDHGFYAEGLRVKGQLDFSHDTVVRGGKLDLRHAKVEGNLDLSNGSNFEDVIEADRLNVSGNLYLGQGQDNPKPVYSTELRLSGAKVEGDLYMDNSVFNKDVKADHLRVTGNLDLQQAIFVKAPELYGAQIMGKLDLTKTFLPGLDLTEAIIGKALLLASPRWKLDAQLTLRNTQVGILQGADPNLQDVNHKSQDVSCEKQNEPFPGNIDLQGFSYDRLQNNMIIRDDKWYVCWLERAHFITPQPYQQLAAVFRAAGDPDRADNVLYAARDREMRESWSKGECWDAAVLFLLKLTIGYGLGFGYFRALVWVAVFTGIGAAILWRKSEEAKNKGRWWCIGASLDHLLPIVEMNKEFSDSFDRSKADWLKGWPFAYFAIQTIIGYVLASFVVAGLAGLTQAQ
jgi:hypothetical protein